MFKDEDVEISGSNFVDAGVCFLTEDVLLPSTLMFYQGSLLRQGKSFQSKRSDQTSTWNCHIFIIFFPKGGRKGGASECNFSLLGPVLMSCILAGVGVGARG